MKHAALSAAIAALPLCGCARDASNADQTAAPAANGTDKTLVAYFSATGTTKDVAERLAAAIGADLFEIVPERPYTAADLNWRDKQSRSSLEMNDRASRPAIAGAAPDFSAYGTVYVGFPIWWYREPSIVDTFVENNAAALAGRTIVPFATSGGSGMGDSSANLQALAPEAKVENGRRFHPSDSAEKLADWARPFAKPAPEKAAAPAPAAPAVVYFTHDITPAGLEKAYKALGRPLEGRKVAVKISTGEAGNTHYLKPALIGPLVKALGGDIVECNTAYGGSRQETPKHRQTIEDRGFNEIAKVVIMDEHDELEIPCPAGSVHLKKDLVGAAFTNYTGFVILNHFKGHMMGGFGGALKNLSIGVASTAGKARIHSAGKMDDAAAVWSNLPEQKDFIESMAEAAGAVVDYMGDRAVYISVMNNLSIDCDCDAHPHKPEMADVGILASLDPVALDKACVDLVYASDPKTSASLRERMETRLGPHILDHAEALGYGRKAYELRSLDEGQDPPSVRRVD